MVKNKISHWTPITTVISIIIALVALGFTYIQIKEINRATQADFAHRFKVDFFTDQSCTLMTLFDYNLIIFQTATNKKNPIDFAYFTVDTLRAKELSKKFPNLFMKKYYSVYEIDNYLLLHFDDLGYYYKRGILDIDFIYDGFDYYVENIYENREIQKYLAWVKTDKNSEDTYEGFDLIYKELKKHSSKYHHQCP